MTVTREMVGNNFKVEVRDVVKNNGISVHGISVLQKGTNCAPVVYLEDLMNPDQTMFDVAELERRIVDIMEDGQAQAEAYGNVPKLFGDYENLRKVLMPRLINKKANEDILDDLVWTPFQDLAIIVTANVTNSANGIGCVKIKKKHLEKLEVDEGQLMLDAFQNLNASKYHVADALSKIPLMMMGYRCEHMESVMDITPDMLMLTLSNETDINGAAMMLRTDLLKAIACQLNVTKLVVLPSSVHEVIVLPYTEMTDIGELTEMVMEVNGSEVSPEEVLSDHAYVYDIFNGWE